MKATKVAASAIEEPDLTRFEPLRRLLAAPEPSWPIRAFWLVASLLAPTLARGVLAPILGNAVPFAAFYPAVLIATLGAGWKIGVVVSLFAAIITNFLFVPPFGGFDFAPSTLVATALFLATACMIVAVAATLRATVAELDRVLQREIGLRLELAHRVKNNLAVVQGLAGQTARTTPDPQLFYEALSGRLTALGHAHNVLSRGDWETCEVPLLVREALGPFQMDGSITFHGEACEIPPVSCVPLVLALHELATNAMKYGSLSIPAGRVEIRWLVDKDDRSSTLRVTWQESGGPTVRPPNRRGLGTRLLRPQAGLQDVRLSFLEGGVRCDIDIDGARTIKLASG